MTCIGDTVKNRIKTKDIPDVKQDLLEKQNYLCGICGNDLSGYQGRDICLDHCHTTGHIRGVLCRNCNGVEGKVYKLANRAKQGHAILVWLKRMIKYVEKHQKTPSGIIHPTHKTEDEKRLLRNKKARERRAKKKSKE